jgi:P-type Cu+ transporter
VDLKKFPNILTVHFRTEQMSLRSLADEVRALGYKEAHYVSENDKQDFRDVLQAEVTKYRNRFFLSLFIQMPIWVLIWIIKYTNPHFLVSPLIYNVVPLYLVIIMVFSSIIQFYLGAPFYSGAYKSVRHGSANMDVLVVLGTTAAWLYGVLLLFIGNPFLNQDNEAYVGHMEGMDPRVHTIHAQAHNFEISSTLITVILLGKLLESFSKKQTVDKLSQLASLKVTRAILVSPPAALSKIGVETDVELLVIGDLVKVQNGSTVPIDGTTVIGTGLCDESMLTGESRPQHKEVGSKVYGGTLLTRGGLIIRVDKLAENAAINQIMKLVESAQSAKAPIQGVADKIAKYFVPTIVLLAVLDWIYWFSFTYSPHGQRTIVLPEGISHF